MALDVPLDDTVARDRPTALIAFLNSMELPR
jgi:hypothetical protein